MREMKNSGIEWIRDIPSTWNIMPNKYLMHKIKNICPIYGGEDILSLTMKGVIVRDLDAGGKMPTSFDGYQHLESGNLLMCLFDIDVTPRCIGLIKQKGLSSPAYSQFKLHDFADASYYCYYYTMLDDDKTLLHLAKNLRHSLTEDQLGAIPTIVPPLAEQKSIATYLDTKCAEIDALIVDIQTQIDTLEQYKRSVITEAVTKGLNPDAKMKDSGFGYLGFIPAHWKIEKFKYHLKFRAEKNRGDSTVLSLYRELGVIPKDSRDDNHNVTSDDTSNYRFVRRGDFVINKMKAWQGSVAVSDYEGIVSPAYYVYEFLNDTFFKRYFHYLMRNKNYTVEFTRMSGGIRVGQWDLSREALESTRILIPPYKEQQAISTYLDIKCTEIDAIINIKYDQLETLESYKKSLIYEYVTGKKEVPVAESDVISVILDPHIAMLGLAIDKLGKDIKGKTQLQKILYLLDEHIGFNHSTQYYRYAHGPYDLQLNRYIDTLTNNRWYKHQYHGADILVKGTNHNNFVAEHGNVFAEKNAQVDKLINFLKPMKTSQVERIATLFAAWNDFIIDGNANPTDDQIINEVMTNWTPNKGHTQYTTWQSTLAKMKQHGIIPKGKGLHTLPMPQKENADE